MHLTKILTFCFIFAFIFPIFAYASQKLDQEIIGLQNLQNRNIVHCYGNSKYSAEECAKYFETQGYTRMRDIPSKSAKYDFLTVDTYPTRRWRNGELTPRW